MSQQGAMGNGALVNWWNNTEKLLQMFSVLMPCCYRGEMNCRLQTNNNTQHDYGRQVDIWSAGEQVMCLNVVVTVDCTLIPSFTVLQEPVLQQEWFKYRITNYGRSINDSIKDIYWHNWIFHLNLHRFYHLNLDHDKYRREGESYIIIFVQNVVWICK